jgi:hypothetical protein
MPLVAVSKDTIRAHVIRYFHDVFGTPTSAFKPGTNVRKAYSYSDRAWRQLANVFNKLSWMETLGAMLSPRAMPGFNTIEDLVTSIWGSLSKIISVPLGAPMDGGAIREFAAPARRPARRARASARKKSSRGKSRAKPSGKSRAKPSGKSRAKPSGKSRAKPKRKRKTG